MTGCEREFLWVESHTVGDLKRGDSQVLLQPSGLIPGPRSITLGDVLPTGAACTSPQRPGPSLGGGEVGGGAPLLRQAFPQGMTAPPLAPRLHLK